MFIEVGPAAIMVEAKKHGEPYRFDSAEIEGYVAKVLADIGEFLPVLKHRAYKIRKTAHLPDVARSMVDAVKRVDETALTPMAAVAGAVADSVKTFLSAREIDFASVNNGGDVSVLSRDGRPVRVGIGDINRKAATPCRLVVEGLVSFGVATSGFGGRSFTLGLADMVSVVALTGALADAAATYICNHTRIDSLNVKRRRAREIDPLTDIPDDLVTVKIGKLSGGEVTEALAAGKRAASRLKSQGIILDAVIVLRDKIVTTINGGGNVQLEVLGGD